MRELGVSGRLPDGREWYQVPIWDESEVQDASNASNVVREISAAVLQDAVIAAVGCGWLLSFGGSRDGFSMSVGVIVDGVSERKWHTNAATLEDALIRLVAAANAAAEAEPPKAPLKAQKPVQGRKRR